MGRLSPPTPPQTGFEPRSLFDSRSVFHLCVEVFKHFISQHCLSVCVVSKQTPLNGIRLEKWRCQTVPDRIKFNKYRGVRSRWRRRRLKNRDARGHFSGPVTRSNMSLVYHPVSHSVASPPFFSRNSDICQTSINRLMTFDDKMLWLLFLFK